MSYGYLTDAELLHVAEDSDSDLVRELAVRFDKLIEAHKELIDAHEYLHDGRGLNDDDDDDDDDSERVEEEALAALRASR